MNCEKTLGSLCSPELRLILYSFLLLFTELTLIRWTGSNIFFLAFYSNFILLASFLGIGLGFLASRTRRQLFPFSPILLALLVLFCYYFRYQYQILLDPLINDLNYDGLLFKDNLFPIWLSLPLIFIMVVMVMTAMADGVARIFSQFKPLQAYRLDIIGSLVGILVFSFLSYLHAPPLYWGLLISLLFIFLLSQEYPLNPFFKIIQGLSCCLLIFVFALDYFAAHHSWSPYYKIGVQAFSDQRYVVNVNGVPQQIIESVAIRKETKPFYFFPYEHAGKTFTLNHVLVVGAGTGGDVAIALAQGAKQVDAVEIDPLIYRLGKTLNPNQPYSDPRVSVFIDDGRSFLQKQQKKYDMIIFALPDSLMLLSGQSSLRLENYLFTLQGFQAAYDHLESDGIFAMYNYYRDRWLIDRLANTLSQVFMHAPCLDTYGESNHWLSVLTISKNANALQCETVWQSVQQASALPSTDDHPFLYLEEKKITLSYLFVLSFILLTAVFAFRLNGLSYSILNQYADLFLMGAAFLLLETKNITHFALLFGSTWLVNALVFIGILFSIYLAIEVTNKIKLNQKSLYGLLLFSLCIAWIISDTYLLALAFFPRFILASVVAFFPIFIANLIFADRFQQTRHAAQAFGANLLGAVFGGVLEYISLLIGYQCLFIVIALLYVLAIWMMKRSNTFLESA